MLNRNDIFSGDIGNVNSISYYLRNETSDGQGGITVSDESLLFNVPTSFWEYYSDNKEEGLLLTFGASNGLGMIEKSVNDGIYSYSFNYETNQIINHTHVVAKINNEIRLKIPVVNTCVSPELGLNIQSDILKLC